MIDESGQGSGFGVVTQTSDTITAIKKALEAVYAKAERAYADEYHKNGVFEDALKAALTSALSAQVQDGYALVPK